MTQQTESPKKEASVSLLPWPVSLAVLMVFIVYVVATVLAEFSVLVYGVVSGVAIDDAVSWLSSSTLLQFILNSLVYGLMVIFLYIFIKSYKTPLSRLGLVKPRLRDIGIALLGVMPYIIGYLILLFAATVIFPSLDIEQEQQIGFEPTENTLELALTFISLVILPPLMEEFIVRGFLFTSLLKRFRFLWAALVTSVIFAVAHLQFGSGAPLLWVAAIDTFVLSLILCYMRYKSGSLWPGIILHGLKNGVAFFSIFVFQIA